MPGKERKGMESVINVLRNSFIFQKLTNEQMKKLAAITTAETHSAGTVLYGEGHPANKFYIVEEGKVVLNMKSDLGPLIPPRQVIVDVVEKGESMGWAAVVDPYIYTRSCICTDRARVVALDAAKLRELLDQDHAMGFEVMKAVSKMMASRLTHTRALLVGERALG
jgi:CRP-like cAMP-binding protein